VLFILNGIGFKKTDVLHAATLSTLSLQLLFTVNSNDSSAFVDLKKLSLKILLKVTFVFPYNIIQPKFYVRHRTLECRLPLFISRISLESSISAWHKNGPPRKYSILGEFGQKVMHSNSYIL